MSEIVLTDDDLSRLERRLGPNVRRMGPWVSDGIFGYCSVRLATVEKAVEALDDGTLRDLLQQLKDTPERTSPFVELLQRSGGPLVEKIVAANQQGFQMQAAAGGY